MFKNKTSFKKAYEAKLKERFNITVGGATMSQLYEVLAIMLNQNLESDYENTQKLVREKDLKKTIYFSMEFLMGRLITNNLQNSGNYQVVKAAFDDYNID